MKRIIAIYSCLRHFIIPESIIELDLAILNGTNLNWIHIPASVKKIINKSLMPGSSFRRITFAKDSRLVELGFEAFGHSEMSCITLPSNLLKYKASTFDCSSVRKVIFPHDCKLRVLKRRTFFYCYNIVRLDIPMSIEIIKMDAVRYCENLEVVNFARGSKLKKILFFAFIECSKLRSINLKDCSMLETVEQESFEEEIFELLGIKPFVSMKIEEDGLLSYFDPDVKIFEFPDEVEIIDEYSFVKRYIIKLSFNKASKLHTIRKFAFCLSWMDRKIKMVEFPPSLEYIEEYAFCNSRNLEKISFMKGSRLKHIKKFAFAFCNIKIAEFPSHCVTVERGAFQGSEKCLDSFFIEWEGTDQEDKVVNKCSDLFFESETIVIPSSVALIENVENGKRTKRIEFEEGSKLVEIRSMANVSENIDLVLPSTVEKIHYNAFQKIRSLSIQSKNIKTQENGVVISLIPRAIVFAPPGIEKIDIDPELEIIHSYAFYKSQIQSISLPNTLKIIGKGAFLDSDLEKIEFSEGTELEILDSFSLHANKLKNIKFPIVKEFTGDSVVTIDCEFLEFPENYCPKRSECLIARNFYKCLR